MEKDNSQQPPAKSNTKLIFFSLLVLATYLGAAYFDDLVNYYNQAQALFGSSSAPIAVKEAEPSLVQPISPVPSVVADDAKTLTEMRYSAKGCSFAKKKNRLNQYREILLLTGVLSNKFKANQRYDDEISKLTNHVSDYPEILELLHEVQQHNQNYLAHIEPEKQVEFADNYAGRFIAKFVKISKLPEVRAKPLNESDLKILQKFSDAVTSEKFMLEFLKIDKND